MSAERGHASSAGQRPLDLWFVEGEGDGGNSLLSRTPHLPPENSSRKSLASRVSCSEPVLSGTVLMSTTSWFCRNADQVGKASRWALRTPGPSQPDG